MAEPGADQEMKRQDEEWMEKYELTQEQVTELREAFALYDEESRGMIEPACFPDVLRAMGQNPTVAQCEEMGKQLEINDFGKVSLEEFVKVVFSHIELKSAEENEEDLLNAFKVFDKNEHGSIPASELVEMLTTHGEALDEEDIAELLKTAEVDKEGKINYFSFMQALVSK